MRMRRLRGYGECLGGLSDGAGGRRRTVPGRREAVVQEVRRGEGSVDGVHAWSGPQTQHCMRSWCVADDGCGGRTGAAVLAQSSRVEGCVCVCVSVWVGGCELRAAML
jgi:hypothetical protein